MCILSNISTVRVNIKWIVCVSITKHSKEWQNEKYNMNLSAYQIFRSRSDWSNFKNQLRGPKKFSLTIKSKKLYQKTREYETL